MRYIIIRPRSFKFLAFFWIFYLSSVAATEMTTYMYITATGESNLVVAGGSGAKIYLNALDPGKGIKYVFNFKPCKGDVQTDLDQKCPQSPCFLLESTAHSYKGSHMYCICIASVLPVQAPTLCTIFLMKLTVLFVKSSFWSSNFYQVCSTALLVLTLSSSA